jgi:CRP-like cAMP-binding protein
MASDEPAPDGAPSPWNRDDTAAFVAIAAERRYKKGGAIVLQGDPPASVHLIVEGWAKVTTTRPSGHEILLLILGPGDLVGYWEVVHGPDRGAVATVEALEPTTTVSIAADRFEEFLVAHPRACLDLLRSVIDVADDIEHRRIDHALVGTGQRLAGLLVDLASRHGRTTPDGIEIAIALSQDEIGGLIGASRDSVIRALTSLRSRGMVVTGRRSMTVRDLDGLRAYAHSERTTG